MTKKALVTGAVGHTGSFLVHELINNGWEVVATDLKMESRSKVMTKEGVFSSSFDRLSIDLEGVTFVAADLTDKESLKALFSDELVKDQDYDVIFHPASLYDYFAKLDILRKINVEGLRNFLEVIKEHHDQKGTDLPHFLHWSTCGVYGQPKYEKTDEGYFIPADEEAPYDPPNNYSISKKEQEILLKKFGKENDLNYTILRSAPIYGPYQTYGMFHIYYMSYLIGSMPLPHIMPRKRALMMPMIHVEDLVRAAVFLANREDAFGEAYNIAADPTTQEEWLAFMFQELGVQYSTIPIWWPVYKVFAKVFEWWGESQEKRARRLGTRPKIDMPMAHYVIHQYYFSNEKLKDLGFKFKYGDFKSGTRQTIRWYIDHGWFPEEDWGKDERFFAKKSGMKLIENSGGSA